MRLFYKQDLDGFFGLFIDNLVQLLLIVYLCREMCGMGGDHAYLLYQHVLPAAGVSILLGNIFYAWQAHRLARREGRDDVTALPYGINTPSLLVYVFFVMAPAYRSAMAIDPTTAPVVAWKMGLLACVGSGLIEFAGAFVAERVRRNTPRAALLSTLAGIAVGFIAMKFTLEILVAPLVAMVPMGIILLTYFAKARMPLGLPGGFVAVMIGTVLAWCLPGDWLAKPMSAEAIQQAWSQRAWCLPQWAGGFVMDTLRLPPGQWVGFLSVIVPMGLFNVIGSLQNIESAEAGGDRFDTRSSLAVNGLGTLVAALFGSCFPTTIYIGHPGWKGLGARAGYSTLNGLIVTIICLTGTVALINSIVPMEAGIAIVMWIGVVITAQAFQATPRAHAPAVAVGLFPAIAAWGATVMWGTLLAAKMIGVGEHVDASAQSLAPIGPGNSLQQLLESPQLGGGTGTMVNGFLVHGLNLMERGYIFTCMIWAAMSALLIDRRLVAAGLWAIIGAAFAALGLTHAYQVTGDDVGFLYAFAHPHAGAYAYRAWAIAAGYVLLGVLFFVFAKPVRPAPHPLDEA